MWGSSIVSEEEGDGRGELGPRWLSEWVWPEGIIRCFNEKSLKNYKQGNDMI